MKTIFSDKYYDRYTNIIKDLSKRSSNYDWITGNNFLGKNGTQRKLRPNGLDKNISKDNLLTLKKIFDKKYLFFFLTSCTLLGAIREKNFIDDDNDTDVCILFEDLPKLILCVPELIKNGLIPLRINNNEITFVKNNEYIDIELLRVETRFTTSFNKVEFCGEEFNIPKNVDEYLTQCYGNWHIKSDKHTWTVPK